MLTITDAYPTLTFANFYIRPNNSYDVFILSPGTALQLVTQNFHRLQPALTITSTAMLVLNPTRYVEIIVAGRIFSFNFVGTIRNQLEGDNCEENGTEVQVVDCLTRELIKDLKAMKSAPYVQICVS